MHDSRPKAPWIVVANRIVEAPGDGFVTRDICRHDGSTMAAFWREDNLRVIAEAGTAWFETGLTPAQLANHWRSRAQAVDYSVLHGYAVRNNLSYNELCAVVRAAINPAS